MIETHSYCKEPKLNSILWRYMDLKKFLSIIHNESLFFSAIKNFEDNFEGSTPLKNIEERTKGFTHLNENELKEVSNKFSELQKLFRDRMFVNCWHKSEVESIAMWKIYSQNHEGIAIKTTHKKLRESITDKRRVFIGKVDYIDYSKDILPQYNAFPHLFAKRKEFSYENEVRLISDGVNEKVDKQTDYSKSSGINIKVNPNLLIEEIVISPYAQNWFYDLVEGIIKQYKLDPKINISRLNQSPSF